MVPDPSSRKGEGCNQNSTADDLTVSANRPKEKKNLPTFQSRFDWKGTHDRKHGEVHHPLNEEPGTPVKSEDSVDGDNEKQSHSPEMTVWIRCDVYDTGIGIPGNAPLC